MTGPDCAVMCNLINIHTYIHIYLVLDRSIYVQFSACVSCVLQINRSGLNQLYPIIYIRGKKNKIKMPNGWRTINSLVHKIRLHDRRGKGMAESFSRQKSRHAPQKEGGLKIPCDLPPV